MSNALKFKALCTGIWTRVWTFFRESSQYKASNVSGYGARMAKILYGSLSSADAQAIIKEFSQIKDFEPNRFVMMKLDFLNKSVDLPVLKSIVKIYVSDDLPKNGTIRLDDEGKLTLKSFSAYAVHKYINVSRSMRGVDNKGYSGITAGYMYGLKYVPQSLIASANWANWAYHIDFKKYKNIIISGKDAPAVQGICFGLQLRERLDINIVVLGVKARSDDFCLPVKICPGTVEDNLSQFLMNDTDGVIKITDVLKYDLSNTLVVYTEMHPLYGGDSKFDDVTDKETINHAKYLMQLSVAFSWVRLVPLMDYLPQIMEKSGLGMSYTAEPHTGYMFLYNKVGMEESCPQYWKIFGADKYMDKTYSMCILSNLLRNNFVNYYKTKPSFEFNKIPPFVYLNKLPPKLGRAKTAKVTGMNLSFENVFSEFIGGVDDFTTVQKFMSQILDNVDEYDSDFEEEVNDEDENKIENKVNITEGSMESVSGNTYAQVDKLPL